MHPAAAAAASTPPPPPRRRFAIQLFPENVSAVLPLSVLLLQTALPLLIRLSRRLKKEGQPAYSPAILTLMAEVFKWLLALLLMTRIRLSTSNPRTSFPTLAVIDCLRSFVHAMNELRSLLVPALLYFISNVVSVYALSLVRSYIFAAIMNSRVVFAALLSIVILNKNISADQCRAVVIISCAAAMLCLEDVQVNDDRSLGEETFGILISLIGAAVSATGGVLMEKLLQPRKASSVSSSLNASILLWEQQCVLACYSALLAFVTVSLFDPFSLAASSMFSGWTSLTWLITALQALHGVLVAATIQHCGIVFRLIIGTLSICLCVIFEAIMLSEPILPREILTIVMVILGSNLYTIRPPPPPIGNSTNRCVDCDVHASGHLSGSSSSGVPCCRQKNSLGLSPL